MIEAGVPAGAVQRRQRVYERVDSADPARGRALRYCEQALDMYRADGDMKEARLLLRSALPCVADYPTIYRGWIAMEEEHEGNVAAARELFEEWGRRCAADPNGAGLQDAGFWCRYLAFEAKNGGAGRARAVAEAAVAACPRDAAVYVKYAKVELRLGHDDRASAVLDRAVAAFAKDAGAKEWVVNEVRRYRDAMRGKRLGGRLGRICRGMRWPRPPRGRGYERLHDESL